MFIDIIIIIMVIIILSIFDGLNLSQLLSGLLRRSRLEHWLGFLHLTILSQRIFWISTLQFLSQNWYQYEYWILNTESIGYLLHQGGGCLKKSREEAPEDLDNEKILYWGIGRYYNEDLVNKHISKYDTCLVGTSSRLQQQQKPVKPVIDAKLLKKFGQTSTCSKVIIAQTKTCSTNVQETSQTLHERCQCWSRATRWRGRGRVGGELGRRQNDMFPPADNVPIMRIMFPPAFIMKQRKNCKQMLSHVTLYWRITMSFEIVVLNCQKCNQCLINGLKSLGLLFEGVL